MKEEEYVGDIFPFLTVLFLADHVLQSCLKAQGEAKSINLSKYKLGYLITLNYQDMFSVFLGKFEEWHQYYKVMLIKGES